MKWNAMGKRQKLYRCLMILFSVFPIKKNLIVISSYYGKGYGDSGKYIAEELLERRKDIKIVWLTNQTDGMPSVIKVIPNNTIKALFYLSTASVWIDNCRKSVYMHKRPGQYYIQTWHGPISFKYCEKDAESNLSAEYVNNCKHDSELIDVFLSGSRWNTDWIRSAFWYTGTIIESGIPRNDLFFKDNEKRIAKLKTDFSCANKKIVLYAPTFRDSKDISVYNLDFSSIKSSFESFYGKEVVIWLRLHPNVSDVKIKDSKYVTNVTFYPDMVDLLLCSDALLTDFSSSAFDAMILNKPCFLIAKDYDTYVNNERGMYFLKDELPFTFSYNENELNDVISNFDQSAYQERIDEFKKRLGVIENGTASSKVADIILDHMS